MTDSPVDSDIHIAPLTDTHGNVPSSRYACGPSGFGQSHRYLQGMVDFSVKYLDASI